MSFHNTSFGEDVHAAITKLSMKGAKGKFLPPNRVPASVQHP